MRVLLIVFYILFISNLSATIINIPADQPTIQDGINVSVDGDTVLVQPNTYYENINYNGKNITVASLFLTIQDTTFISQTIIDGNENGTVVIFENNENYLARLIGFTFKNGSGNEVDWGTPYEPWLVYLGGAVYCKDSSPIISNSTFKLNYAGYGGAVYLENSNALLHSLIIVDNESDDGGGIHISSNYGEPSEPLITDCIVSNNLVDFGGGGVWCDYSNPTFTNCQIIDNQTDGGQSTLGGGLVFTNSNPFLSACRITGNSSGHLGGGIYSYNSEITFDDNIRCDIYSNLTLVNNANEIFSNQYQMIIVDTFTVLNPTSMFAAPIDNFDFDILHGLLPQTNSNLYVSPNGDNSNSGLSWEKPLRNINYALNIIEADSLNPKTIFLDNGIFSPSTNNEQFPLNCISYITITGLGTDETIIDASESSSGFAINLSNNILIENLTIINGNNNHGGGIQVSSSQFNLNNVIIDDCSAMGGGGISLQYSDAVFQDIVIRNNQASGFGGGIYTSHSELTMNSVLIDANHSDDEGGGALFWQSSLINCHNLIVSNNTSSGDGGGFCIESNETIVECYDSEFFDNCANGNGGAISNNANHTILNNLSIYDNQSNEYGGGICFWGSFYDKVENCQIYNNLADYGGAIAICGYGNPIISNNTIFDNDANHGGGIYFYYTNSSIILNTILFNDYPEEIYISNSYPEVTIAYCDIQGGFEDIYVYENAILNWSDGNINSDPLFEDPTNSNFNLQEISPCVDAGTNYFEWQGNVIIDIPPENYEGNAPDMGGIESPYTVGINDYIVSVNKIALKQNYPNPFNPSTTIEFSIQNDSKIELSIHNIKGQKIKTLANNDFSKGNHSLVWNGIDESNKFVGSGVYLYKLKVNGKTEALKKCLLLK